MECPTTEMLFPNNFATHEKLIASSWMFLKSFVNHAGLCVQEEMG
jgi:hypothetical protein